MMRAFAGLLLASLLLAAVGVSVASAAAAPEVPALPSLPPLPPSMPVSVPVPSALPRVRSGAFDLRFVTVGQVIDLVYGDALKVPHVISDDVLQDKRLVSFQFDAASSKVDLRAFMRDFLDSLGFEIRERDGVDFVGRRADAPKPEQPPKAHYVYRAQHRSADYLVRVLSPLFGGSRGVVAAAPVATSAVVAGAGSPVSAARPSLASLSGAAGGWGGSQASLVSSDGNVIFIGPPDDVAQLKALLPELDVSPGELVVRGWVYEVSNDDSKQDAFSIAVHVLGGVLSVSNSSATSTDTTSFRFSGPHIDAAISALNATSNFRQVSSPHVRVQSGEHVRLNVGEQVPTLSSVSYEGNSGTPVQSVAYQDAGLIFDVTPTLVGSDVDVKVDEEISGFVATTTGVQGSPTKNTRQMQTQTRMADGEVIVIGGLTQDTTSAARNHFPWLPSFLDGKSSDKGSTQILLVLQVQRI